MSEVISFDLTPIEIPYKIGDKEYVLQEAMSDAAVKWRNASIACTKYGADGNPQGFSKLGDLEPLLVSLCLFEVEDGSGIRKPMQESQVRKWPHRIITSLFDKAKKISKLDADVSEEDIEKQIAELQAKLAELRDEDETAKNSETLTTDGSD